MHSHYRRYRLQVRNDRQDAEVACVDNPFNPGKMLPDGRGEFLGGGGYMRIRNNSYAMLQFGLPLSFAIE